MDKISVTVVGDNRVDLVQRLRAFADNLDGSPAEPTGKVTKSAVKPAPAKKAAAQAEEDDGFVTEEAGEPEGFDEEPAAEASFDEEEKPAPKAAKGTKKAATKKLTLDDVNDACKAHAAAKGRPATMAILQSKFKTQSVATLKPEQYEKCISAMSVN